jgi:hypothetical protein
MTAFWNAISAVTSLSTDILVLIALTLLFFAGTLYFGKRRAVAAILSLYVAFNIYINFAYINSVTFLNTTGDQITISHLIIFGLITLLCFYIISSYIGTDFSFSKSHRLISALLLSVSITILLLLVAYYLIPIFRLYNFSPQIDSLFRGGTALFWWLMAPLAALLITSRF